ncbi:MAG: putative DNA binding domain-containing protein [Dehalococcoidia bacterium]|nr:putative DNA binding domain-containing protein [Dehalococcoidia bacterium]
MVATRKGGKRKPASWRRIDLHIHTPKSLCYREPGVTYLQILQKAEERNLDIIAITDHNSVAGYAAMMREVEQLELLDKLGRLKKEESDTLAEYQRLLAKIVVLPGFEFTATLGFHLLGIYPEKTPVRRLEHILLDLNVPEASLDFGSSEVGATTDVITAFKIIDDNDGLVVAAHANSNHGVALFDYNFGGQSKISMTQDKHLHALEVTDLDSTSKRRTATFFNGSRPEYPRKMFCIQGSDAHRLDRESNEKQEYLGVGDRVTEVLIDEVSCQALKELFLSNQFAHVRAQRVVRQAFDEIMAARQEGPSIVRSFYDAFPAKPLKRAEVLNDVVAFSNTKGGTIYIGTPAGIKAPARGVDRPEEAIGILRSEMQKNIAPPLEVGMEVKTSEGKNIIVLDVPEGVDTPYTVGAGQIYVRQESETGVALRDEIVRLVLRGARRVEPERQMEPENRRETVVAPAQELETTTSSIEEVTYSNAPEPPKTGAEIMETEGRDGVFYHTIRDLRNGNVMRNVTRFSARHLWHYAITQHEDHPAREEEVQWRGDLGLWKAYTRMGTKRYNFVLRNGDGPLRVFYGVTKEGIHGQWQEMVPEEQARDGEQVEP